jgi:mannose-6-phosphate isomerase-like protein (cupin superfamily)
VHPSPQYLYEMLCTDLSRKHFVPQITRIVARSLADFSELPRHDGEEFIYVVSGAVELHTEFYEPTRLDEGDAAYFDSTMGHALVSVGAGDATVLWVTARAEKGAPAGTGKRRSPPRGRPRA